MLILSPSTATFGTTVWDNILSINIDRSADRVAMEWSDEGPHPTFVDVPEQRTTIVIRCAVLQDDLRSPRPADSGELTFFAVATGGRTKIAAQAVVQSIRHDLVPSGNGKPATAVRMISLLAVSSDGASDPITMTDAL